MDRPPVAFEIVTPPEDEPVTLDQAKAQCRITSSDEDTSLAGWIQTARELVEIRSERALMAQTRRMWIDNFPRGYAEAAITVPSWNVLNSGQILYLPWKPINSVEVEYCDQAGTWQTVDPSLYVADLASAPARLQPVYGQIWPINRIQINAVKITFDCGAASAAAVPAIAKQAILLLVGHWYENREAVGKVPDEIALGFESLLNAIRWH